MKQVFWLTGLIGLSVVLSASPALADVPSLQVAPLSYQGTLKPGVVETGYIDVANPSDEAIQVTSSVQGFRQVDTKGDLAFYADPAFSSAITVSLTNFQLGPRQAVRDVFNIDGAKLPLGGVYAAIFFRTVPTSAASSNNSYVLQSANVGTLLILTNGHASPYRGAITGLSMPAIQIGGGLSGSLAYKNTDQSLTAVGFKPKLSSAVFPWGRPTAFQSGLILPGVTRDFSFTRGGSYFGVVPVTVTDTETGAHATAWVLADTGYYQLGFPIAVVLFILLVIWLRPYAPHGRRAFSQVQKGPARQKPAMDALVRRPNQTAPVPRPEEDTISHEQPAVSEPELESTDESPTVLEQLEAKDAESDSGLDHLVKEPSEGKVKIKVETPKPKPRSKPKPKHRPGRPKKSD